MDRLDMDNGKRVCLSKIIECSELPRNIIAMGRSFQQLCYVLFFFLLGISFLQTQKIISSTLGMRHMYIVFKAYNCSYF